MDYGYFDIIFGCKGFGMKEKWKKEKGKGMGVETERICDRWTELLAAL